MPVIIIKGPKNISKETKKELIERTSQVASECYNLPIESINIIIEEDESDNVGVGGKQLSEIRKE